MRASIRTLVRERAGFRCEYCRMHEDDDPYFTFHIEHIIAKQHGGTDDDSNLAWSCHACNESKGPNLASVDNVSGKIVRLFHPREQRWSRHFAWSGAELMGRTQIGRATIRVLNLNDPRRVSIRELLIELGTFPPDEN